MAVMLKYLYEALVSAGVTEDKASKAAEEMAGYESELNKIKSDILVIKWMNGFIIVMLMFVLGKLYK
jgi:hypothetical protein